MPVNGLTMAGGTLSGQVHTSVNTLVWTSGTMGEYELNNFGGATTVAGTASLSGALGKQLHYGRVLRPQRRGPSGRVPAASA